MTAADKTAVRISGEAPIADDRLISWRDYADRHGCDRKWYRDMDHAGGLEARKWWIYRGTVSPEWFVDVDFFDGDVISDFEKRIIMVAEQSSSYDDMMKKMTVKSENGLVFVDPFAVALD